MSKIQEINSIVKSYSHLKSLKNQETQDLVKQFNEVRDSLPHSGESKLNIYAVADLLGRNDSWRNDFSKAFSNELVGNKSTIKFNVLSEADKNNLKAYDVTVTGTQGLQAGGTIGTDIVPTLEALVSSTGILSRILIKDVGVPTINQQMYDFGDDSLENASNLSEIQAGTDVDTITRKGDLLTPQFKLQRSTTISDLAFRSFDATEYGIFMARIIRAVQKLVVQSILYGGSTAANGTSKNGIRGIKNNFGSNGTGDATGTIGAITFNTKALADAYLQTNGVSPSTDAYDLCVKMKRGALPRFLSQEEEDKYVFVMNRNTWGQVSTVQDLNGRYKAQNAVDIAGNVTKREIDGTQVEISPFVDKDEVFLVPLAYYQMITAGGFMSVNDGGILKIKEGEIVYVSKIYADGSMRYGQKYRSNTAVTIGTTPFDNHDQNLYRVFKIA